MSGEPVPLMAEDEEQEEEFESMDQDEEDARIGALIDALSACLLIETGPEQTRTKVLIAALEAAKKVAI